MRFVTLSGWKVSLGLVTMALYGKLSRARALAGQATFHPQPFQCHLIAKQADSPVVSQDGVISLGLELPEIEIPFDVVVDPD